VGATTGVSTECSFPLPWLEMKGDHRAHGAAVLNTTAY